MTLPLGSMRQAIVIGGSSAREVDGPTATVSVDPNIVASVTLSPSAFSAIEGLDVQDITATPRNNSGGVIGGKIATWQSSDEALATIVSTGSLSARFTAIADGSVTITATIDGIDGTAAATVLPGVASVSIAPNPINIVGSGSVSVSAAVLDDQGGALPGRNINWLSDDAGIASVTPGVDYNATVTGAATGSAIIRATVEAVTGTSTAVVTTSSADLSLDFNTPLSLGVNVAGDFSHFPLGTPGATLQPAHQESDYPEVPWGIYRKHGYLPTGGRGGSGAIDMHWRTGMSIGFSPVWITVPVERHFKVIYHVKQSAEMIHASSDQKIHRMRADGVFIGTLMSKHGAAHWRQEAWNSNLPISDANLGFDYPTDNLWHKWEIELDYRNILDLIFRFWVDDVLIKEVRNDSKVGDVMAGATTLTFNPFVEMYSCGDSGACSAGINTGDFIVDDFSYTVL